MGVSPHTARRYLYKLRGSRQANEVSEKEIGTLIQDYLNDRELSRLSKSIKDLDRELSKGISF